MEDIANAINQRLRSESVSFAEELANIVNSGLNAKVQQIQQEVSATIESHIKRGIARTIGGPDLFDINNIKLVAGFRTRDGKTVTVEEMIKPCLATMNGYYCPIQEKKIAIQKEFLTLGENEGYIIYTQIGGKFMIHEQYIDTRLFVTNKGKMIELIYKDGNNSGSMSCIDFDFDIPNDYVMILQQFMDNKPQCMNISEYWTANYKGLEWKFYSSGSLIGPVLQLMKDRLWDRRVVSLYAMDIFAREKQVKADEERLAKLLTEAEIARANAAELNTKMTTRSDEYAAIERENNELKCALKVLQRIRD